MRKVLLFATIIVAVTQLAAQTKPPAGGGSTPTTTTGAPGSGNRLPTGPTAPPVGPYPSDSAHPIFLSGRVVLDDGTAPPGPVTIQRVCSNGRPIPEGYSDSKGRFSITLGQEMGITPDASETQSRNQQGGVNPMGGVKESQLMTCDLRAALPGYRSEMVSLSNRRYMDNPDVGVIILHHLANVEGMTTSATSSMAPKDARKAFDKGLDAAKKSKPDDAQREFEKAVEIFPKFASAWFELGRVYESRDHYDKARQAYDQAVAADPKFINPYERIYMLQLREEKWKDVAETTDKVLHLNPYDFANAYYFNSYANLQLGNLDAAEKSGREAVKLDAAHQNPKAIYILGIALAQKQDYKSAADCLRTYLQNNPDVKDVANVQKQLGELEKSLSAKSQQEQQK